MLAGLLVGLALELALVLGDDEAGLGSWLSLTGLTGLGLALGLALRL